jgi:hypothetical protein
MQNEKWQLRIAHFAFVMLHFAFPLHQALRIRGTLSLDPRRAAAGDMQQLFERNLARVATRAHQ